MMKKDLVGTIDELIPDVITCDMYSIDKKVLDDKVVWRVSSFSKQAMEGLCNLFNRVLDDTYVLSSRVDAIIVPRKWCCEICLIRCGLEHVWDGDKVRKLIRKREEEMGSYEAECEKAYS